MHGDDYRLIAEHPLRHALRGVCTDPRDVPGRKALRAQIVEALPDVEDVVIDAIMTKAAEFARACVDPGARFDTRASADALTLHVLKTYEAADRLVQVQEEEIDAAALADQVMEPNDVEKALHAITSRLPDSERSW